MIVRIIGVDICVAVTWLCQAGYQILRIGTVRPTQPAKIAGLGTVEYILDVVPDFMTNQNLF